MPLIRPKKAGPKPARVKSPVPPRRKPRLLSKYKWIIGVPGILLAYLAFAEKLPNPYLSYQKDQVLSSFDRKSSELSGEPAHAVFDSLVLPISRAKPQEVKRLLSSTGTAIVDDFMGIYYNVRLKNPEKFSVVAGRVAVMEVLTDSSAAKWIRDVAADSPYWFLGLGRTYARERMYSKMKAKALQALRLSTLKADTVMIAKAHIELGACYIYGWHQ